MSFADPIFALWLARRTGKVGPVERETTAGLRKIVAQLGANFAKPYEAYGWSGWPASTDGAGRRRCSA